MFHSCKHLCIIASNPLLWHHNGRDGVSNLQPCDCLLNHSCSRKLKKTSKRRVIGLFAGNSSVTDVFPSQMASNAENVSLWWHHHALVCGCCDSLNKSDAVTTRSTVYNFIHVLRQYLFHAFFVTSIMCTPCLFNHALLVKTVVTYMHFTGFDEQCNLLLHWP